MKKILGVFLIISSAIVLAKAQNSPAVPTSTFETLKLNSSPAFVLLGVEPENIQRPTTPTQFIAGVQNSIVNGKPRPNVAFEITPFYIKKSRGVDSLRFKPYEYLLSPQQSLLNNIAKTLSISLGTSESDSVVYGNLHAGTALGIGFRSMILEGQRKKGIVSLLKEWHVAYLKNRFYSDLIVQINTSDADMTKMINVASAVQTQVGVWKSISLKNLDFNAMSYSLADKIISDLAFQITDKIEKGEFKAIDQVIEFLKNGRDVSKIIESNRLVSINQQQKLPFAKEGFMLELAAGQALLFQNNQFQNITLAKTAIWLTPSYRWQLNSHAEDIKLIDLMGVLRYTFNNRRDSVDVSNYFDTGAKIQYIINSWSFSFEGVYRYASEAPLGIAKKYTWRYVSSLDYKLNDAVSFKFSFGGNFNGNTATYTNPKEVFALGGLNFGLLNPKTH